MKHFLLSAALLFAGPALAQSASVPLRKANVIAVRTSDSLGVAYTKLARVLVAAGYGIDKSDKELGAIQTTPHATAERKAVSVGTRIVFLKEPQCTVIEVRGTYRLLDDVNGVPVSNIGQRGSAAAVAWNELERVAKLYPGGIIAYRVEY